MIGQLPDDCTAPSGLGHGVSVHARKLPDGVVPVVVRGASGVESDVEVETVKNRVWRTSPWTTVDGLTWRKVAL